MQWKLGPVWQPCSGQSKTGSIQSFELHPLAPPSPVAPPELLPLLLLPPNRPPSGSVIGGNEMPLLEPVAPLLLPLTPLLLPPTPLLEEVGAEPSSPLGPEEEDGAGPVVASSPLPQELQPPLVVPEPPLDPPPPPELLPPWPWPPSPESKPWSESATLAVHPAATTPNDTTQTNANFSSNLMAEGES
jgi:hypothetical protein